MGVQRGYLSCCLFDDAKSYIARSKPYRAAAGLNGSDKFGLVGFVQSLQDANAATIRAFAR